MSDFADLTGQGLDFSFLDRPDVTSGNRAVVMLVALYLHRHQNVALEDVPRLFESIKQEVVKLGFAGVGGGAAGGGAGGGVGVAPGASLPGGDSLRPRMDPKTSVRDDIIYCLVEGCDFGGTILTRHLKGEHNLSPSEYRRRFALPADIPMSSRNWSRERSRIGKKGGFKKGHKGLPRKKWR